MRVLLVSFLSLPLSLPLLGAPVPKVEPVDWKAAIRHREFKFDASQCGIAAAKRAGLTVEFDANEAGATREYYFSRKDGPKITVAGHADSPFVARGDALYFAHYHPSSSGCTVVAFDLTTGKKAWSRPLEGLGPIDHSKYRNKVAMAVEKHPDSKDAFALVVTGWEAAGGYVEVIDLVTGKQLANKKFDSDDVGLPK
jgi:hypothetical protein